MQLTLNNNTGSCPLSISGIVSSPPTNFLAPLVTSYPLVINPGASLDVVLRFKPTSLFSHTATLTLLSNDPTGPSDADAHRLRPGAAAGPHSRPTAAISATSASEPSATRILILDNDGKCSLSITKISSSSPEFLAPQVLTYPLAIGAGDSLEVPIRFQPTSIGTKTATITIDSNDPSGPRTAMVKGHAPAGKLAVTGSTSFGGVTACCCADRTIWICNVGDCKLHVSGVAFKRKSSHWKLLHNPFPATLRPGSCLSLTIRYKATEKCPRSCELVITSDDPETPVRTLEVLAYTILGPVRLRKVLRRLPQGGLREAPHRALLLPGISVLRRRRRRRLMIGRPGDRRHWEAPTPTVDRAGRPRPVAVAGSAGSRGVEDRVGLEGRRRGDQAGAVLDVGVDGLAVDGVLDAAHTAGRCWHHVGALLVVEGERFLVFWRDILTELGQTRLL